MFRQLLATAAVSVCCLGNPAAKAMPTNCWLHTSGIKGQSVPAQVCDIAYRTNANGHTVIDLITVQDGGLASIVLWQNSAGQPTYAEVFLETSGRSVWSYRIDKDGDVNLWHPATGMEIWFLLLQSDYELNPMGCGPL